MIGHQSVQLNIYYHITVNYIIIISNRKKSCIRFLLLIMTFIRVYFLANIYICFPIYQSDTFNNSGSIMRCITEDSNMGCSSTNMSHQHIMEQYVNKMNAGAFLS